MQAPSSNAGCRAAAGQAPLKSKRAPAKRPRLVSVQSSCLPLDPCIVSSRRSPTTERSIAVRCCCSSSRPGARSASTHKDLQINGPAPPQSRARARRLSAGCVPQSASASRGERARALDGGCSAPAVPPSNRPRGGRLRRRGAAQKLECCHRVGPVMCCTKPAHTALLHSMTCRAAAGGARALHSSPSPAHRQGRARLREGKYSWLRRGGRGCALLLLQLLRVALSSHGSSAAPLRIVSWDLRRVSA